MESPHAYDGDRSASGSSDGDPSPRPTRRKVFSNRTPPQGVTENASPTSSEQSSESDVDKTPPKSINYTMPHPTHDSDHGPSKMIPKPFTSPTPDPENTQRPISARVRPSEVGDVCDTSIKSMQKASKQKSKKSKEREPLKELQQNTQ